MICRERIFKRRWIIDAPRRSSPKFLQNRRRRRRRSCLSGTIVSSPFRFCINQKLSSPSARVVELCESLHHRPAQRKNKQQKAAHAYCATKPKAADYRRRVFIYIFFSSPYHLPIFFKRFFFFRLTKLKATTEASSLSPSDLQLIESGCASVLALKTPKKKSLLAIRLLRLLLLLLLRSTTMTKDCRLGSAVSFCGRLDRYDLWKIHYLISSIQVVDSCEKKKKSLFPV